MDGCALSDVAAMGNRPEPTACATESGHDPEGAGGANGLEPADHQPGRKRPASTLALVQPLRTLGRLDVGSAGGSAAISPLQAARLARQAHQRASRRNDNSFTTGP